MPWAQVHWRSEVLAKQTTMQVILPSVGRPPYATLYLLHGLSDDSTTWLRRSRIEAYVRELPADRGHARRLPGFLHRQRGRGRLMRGTSARKCWISWSAIFPRGRRAARAPSAGCRWAATARCGWRWAIRRNSARPTAIPARWCGSTSTRARGRRGGIRSSASIRRRFSPRCGGSSAGGRWAPRTTCSR